ncbi:hypothetical protein [Mycobacterium intermedium]|uniref:hypothetical protein n=1 Tax=Mycobacterium intermedium TaxID=28445 RepID=UPI0020124DF6|nr:hypothetical protein [Mycobacterium intermedium]
MTAPVHPLYPRLRVRIAAETFNRPAAMSGENIMAAASVAFATFKIQRTFPESSPKTR